MFSLCQGVIANVPALSGGTPIVRLTEVQFAVAAIVITTIRWSLGIAKILFHAGLQAIGADLDEAGALDNATAATAFRCITQPNLERWIMLVVVCQTILYFQVFRQSHLMTPGGRNDTTQVLVRHICQTGFRDSESGRAAAMAVFLFITEGAFSRHQCVVGRAEDQ